MREILFRAKAKNNGKWVYGTYCPYDWNICGERKVNPQIIIISDDKYIDGLWCEVIPETVGQYTGLTDKNGKKIFEGDIAITKTTSSEFVGCISYSTEYVRFVCTTKSKIPYPMDKMFEYEVIGNIHDNPELLKVGDDK